MDPPSPNSRGTTRSGLRQRIVRFWEKYWLLVGAVFALSVVAGLAWVDKQGRLVDLPRYVPGSYASLCPLGNAPFDNGRPFYQQTFQPNTANGPSLREIVAGLGTPEYVSHSNDVHISGEATAVTISLEYPSQGVSVLTTQWEPGANWQMKAYLTGNLRVQNVFCYRPGASMEQVLRDVYRLGPDHIEDEMSRFIPWPGFDVWVP